MILWNYLGISSKSGIIPAKKAFEKYPTIQKFCGDGG